VISNNEKVLIISINRRLSIKFFGLSLSISTPDTGAISTPGRKCIEAIRAMIKAEVSS
jgi:predicted RNA-binding protein YlqC (UPF0109 family)